MKGSMRKRMFFEGVDGLKSLAIPGLTLFSIIVASTFQRPCHYCNVKQGINQY